MRVNSPWPVQYAMPPMRQHKCSRGECHSVVAVLQLRKLHLPEFLLKLLSCAALFSSPSKLFWTKVMLSVMGAVFKHCHGYIITTHGFHSKVHLGAHSDEKNFIWKIMMRECSYLASKLLKCVWFLNTEG